MESIVKLYLPLHTWVLQKACGPVFTDAIWREIALSLVPPSHSMVNTIVRECGDFDSPALLAPSYRRRVRNRYKRYVRRQLRDNPAMLAVRGWLLRLRQEFEAKGHTGDPARIRKLRDIEAETNDYYASGHAQDDLLNILELGDKDRIPESVDQEWLDDATSLMWEFSTYGEGGTKPTLRQHSGLWQALDIDPEKLEAMTLEDGLLHFMSKFQALIGLNGEPPKQSNLRRLLKWIIRTHLPHKEEPSTTPKAMGEAIRAGLVHKGIKAKDKKTGEVTVVDIEDPNAANFVSVIEYLSDSDRLSQFCELAGIDMESLTDGEVNRLKDLLYALDPDRGGFDLASKQGVSLAAYYGDKADSEKTQRQRLFKKIKEASNKPK